MKVLVTSGGTQISIDDVRHIGNMSKGTFGAKIATEFLKIPQAKVSFLRAEHSCSPYSLNIDLNQSCSMENDIKLDDLKRFYFDTRSRYNEISYKTFQDYEKEFLKNLTENQPDIVVLAAAVSDYDVGNKVSGKIRSKDAMSISLVHLPKMISKVRTILPKAVLVGFKLLVGSKPEDLVQTAMNSCKGNDCDFVVANDLSDLKAGNHIVRFVIKNGLFETVNPKEGRNPAKEIVDLTFRCYVGRQNK